MLKKYIRHLVLLIVVLLTYANTLLLDYALDDRLLIYENEYTLKGWKGLKDICTKDSFSGFFTDSKNMVAGGRYRPLAQCTFAIEYELFGGNLKSKIDGKRSPQNEQLFSDSHLPVISHLFNLLYYALLVLLLFVVLQMLFQKYDSDKWWRSIPFITALLFALHPLHTEVVANIKGRDEIFSMLGAVATLYFCLKYVESHKYYHLLLALLTMTFALFSKENAIVFVAVVPLSLLISDSKISWKDYVATEIPIFVAVAIFLVVRQRVLGAFMVEDTTNNILNNPFLNCSINERIATVLLTWGVYLKLMVFPHPLTHDYYPHQIEITNFSNPIVIILLILFIILLIWSVLNIKKNKVLAYSVLFFAITFSITSNLLFPVGTLMNERFLFVPLLGFVLALAYLFQKLNEKFNLDKFIPILLIIIMIGYGVKSFARNFVWKDDITLFTTDVKVSANSIKCNISAGGSYLQLYKKDNKIAHFKNAEKYLTQALTLEPTAYNALMLMGELYYVKQDYEKSFYYYHKMTEFFPEDAVAQKNMQAAQMALGNDFVKKINQMLETNRLQDAWREIDEVLKQNPLHEDALNMKGKIFGQYFGQLDSARAYLFKVLEINPKHLSALENIGVSYAIEGKNMEALSYLNQARSLDPNNRNVLLNLLKLYQSMGNNQKAEEIKEKLQL